MPSPWLIPVLCLSLVAAAMTPCRGADPPRSASVTEDPRGITIHLADGAVITGKLKVDRIIEAVGSPTYVYSQATFLDHITKIQKAYGLRCKLVHKGNRHAPTPKDLYFTDDLLLSLLANLVTHSKIFSSKDDLTKFSERLQAARLLKVEKRIRPRSLRVFRRAYSARDYNIY